jgi:hypothetical protein
MRILYYAAACAAIALSCVLTTYSSLTSWYLTHDPVGPIAAISASIGLMLAVFTFTHHRGWPVRFLGIVVGIVGMTAAVISGGLVKQRVATSLASQVQSVKDTNVPRKQATLALASAESELKTAVADARAECRKPRNKTACGSAAKRETDARKRVTEARAKVGSVGAHASEEHAAPEAAAFLPIALPIWVELAAPIFAALGIAIWPQGVSPVPTPLATEQRNHKPVAPATAAQPKSATRSQPRSQPSPQPKKGSGRKPRKGTREYWWGRLVRSRPDLAARVRAGEMSVNFATILAGWRKSPVRVVA